MSGKRRSALTPTELKQAALAERRKREAAAGVGEGDLSHGRPPASPANRNPYWQAAKNGDHKPAPVPANAWKNTLTKKAHPREPTAAGQQQKQTKQPPAQDNAVTQALQVQKRAEKAPLQAAVDYFEGEYKTWKDHFFENLNTNGIYKSAQKEILPHDDNESTQEDVNSAVNDSDDDNLEIELDSDEDSEQVETKQEPVNETEQDEEVIALQKAIQDSRHTAPPAMVSKQTTTEGNVHKAFKDLFGYMLSKCRKSIFDSWMKDHVDQSSQDSSIKKRDWRTVIATSSAVWYAVVLAFRKVIALIQDESNNMVDEHRKRFSIKITEDVSEYKLYWVNGLNVAVHYTDNNSQNVNRHVFLKGPWVHYITKQFQKNGLHFVREFQEQLTQKIWPDQAQNEHQTFFGFWFTVKDIENWKTAINEIASGTNSKKVIFEWPSCCKSIATDQAPPVFRKFCTHFGYSIRSGAARQECVMRARACFQFYVSHCNEEDYLTRNHVQEVQLENYDLTRKDGGAFLNGNGKPVISRRVKDSVHAGTYGELRRRYDNLDPEAQKLFAVRVWGAKMNPYLCAPP
jgi:hypothetical protein